MKQSEIYKIWDHSIFIIKYFQQILSKMGRKNVGKKTGSKRSISAVKKNNLKRHKLVKAGKLKPKSSPRYYVIVIQLFIVF